MKNDGHFPDLDGRAHSLKNLIRLNTSYTCNLPCADYILVEKVQKEKKKDIHRNTASESKILCTGNSHQQHINY